MREIPQLYEVAKQICHDHGMEYRDPRTGQKYPAPSTDVVYDDDREAIMEGDYQRPREGKATYWYNRKWETK